MLSDEAFMVLLTKLIIADCRKSEGAKSSVFSMPRGNPCRFAEEINQLIPVSQLGRHSIRINHVWTSH